MRVWTECGRGGIGTGKKSAKVGGVEAGNEGRSEGEEEGDSVWGEDGEDGAGEGEGDGWDSVSYVGWAGFKTNLKGGLR